MSGPHKKIQQGDHMIITYHNEPMSLDDVVFELNKLYEIAGIVDETPEINMGNYDEDQVRKVNDAIIQIHGIAFSTPENKGKGS